MPGHVALKTFFAALITMVGVSAEETQESSFASPAQTNQATEAQDAQSSSKVVLVDATLEADLKSLDHPDFKTREAASVRILKRSADVVDVLIDLAKSKRPELSARSFELLRQIHRDGDEASFEKIEAGYQSIVESEDIGASMRAERAMDAASIVRRERAITALKRLGAIVRFIGKPDEDDSTGVELEQEAGTVSPRVATIMLNRAWKGGDEGLKHLMRIDELRYPDPLGGGVIYLIKGAKISDDAKQAMKFTFPRCDERGAAYLGIQPFGFGEVTGVMIRKVVPGSAADRAGLVPGDVILKFEDAPVTDFKELVDRIGEHEPGEKIPLVYLRDGKQETVTVELRGWE